MDVQLLVAPNCPTEQRAREMVRHALIDAGAGDTPIRTVVVSRMHARRSGPQGVPEVTVLIAAIRRATAKPDAGAAAPYQDRQRSAATRTAIDSAAGR